MFLAEGVKDPRVTGLVTVTGVDVTRDLRHAKVHVSILGTETEKTSTMEGLQSVAGIPPRQARSHAATPRHPGARLQVRREHCACGAHRLPAGTDPHERGGPGWRHRQVTGSCSSTSQRAPARTTWSPGFDAHSAGRAPVTAERSIPSRPGLLVVALGRATRLIRFMPSEPKVYRATITFGTATDSDDSTGHVVARRGRCLTSRRCARDPRADRRLEQLPPAYSARHVDGRRAYEIAREGGTPELSPSTVTVHEWDVHSFDDGRLDATITCSSGTYIRALARDLGRFCGTVAHLSALRRTRIGPFDVADAVAPDEATPALVRPSTEALAGMARQVVADDDVERLSHGRPVSAHEDGTSVGARRPGG